MSVKAKVLYAYTWKKVSLGWNYGGDKKHGINMAKGEIVTVLHQSGESSKNHARGHWARVKNRWGQTGSVLASAIQIIDNSRELHEKEMSRLRVKEREAATRNRERLMREQARLEKERKAEESRQQQRLEAVRAEQRRRDQESRSKIEAQRRADEREREQLRQMAAKNEAERQMRIKEFDAKKEKEEAERKAKAERERREHEKKLKDMQLKQQNDNKEAIERDIEKHKVSIKEATEQLVAEEKIIGETDQKLKSLDLKVLNFDKYKEGLMLNKKQELDLKTLWDRFNANDSEISKAIEKTGQTEGNVGRFLELTHGLLGATMKTAMDTNKMGAQVSTFNELIQRECCDTLTIQQLAQHHEHLKRFVPFFAAKGMQNVRSLRCRSEEAFKDITSMLEAATAKKRKEDAAKLREEEAAKKKRDAAAKEKEDATKRQERDDALRMEWALGSECEVFSESQEKWCGAEIVSIETKEDGEWLVVAYDGNKKEIQRGSDWIRPAMVTQDAEKQLVAAQEAAAETKEEKEEEEEAEELSVEDLLTKHKLIKFWAKMEEDGWDEPADWPEMTKEDLKELGIKGGNLKKWNRMIEKEGDTLTEGVFSVGKGKQEDKLLTRQEIDLLHEICFEPETWAKFQEAQELAARSGLKSTSPLLSDFFERIYGGIKRSDKFLELTKAPNSDQVKAIEMAENQPPPKALTLGDAVIEEADEDDDDDDAKREPDAAGGDHEVKENETMPIVEEPVDDQDQAQRLEDEIRTQWIVGSECEVFSESQQKWTDSKIVAIREEEDAEWLMVKYDGNDKQFRRGSDWIRPAVAVQDQKNQMVLHSQALKEAALREVAITQTMMDKFNESPQTKGALTVAIGVEDCCKQVIMSQSTIRQSVLLSMAILDLKPNNMKPSAQALWDAVDTGVSRLLRSAVTMAKASTEFFGYFLRFKSSFQYYESNVDAPLLVSLQFLHKDVNEFSDFQAKFMETVNALNDEAMQCINNCVKQQGGAAAYEAARKEREKNKNNYLAAKAKYDQRSVDLDMEFDKLQAERVSFCAEKARAICKRDTLKDAIKQNTELQMQLEAAKEELLKTIIE